MTVAPGPAPLTLTLLSIMTPPAYVPRPIVIVRRREPARWRARAAHTGIRSDRPSALTPTPVPPRAAPAPATADPSVTGRANRSARRFLVVPPSFVRGSRTIADAAAAGKLISRRTCGP